MGQYLQMIELFALFGAQVGFVSAWAMHHTLNASNPDSKNTKNTAAMYQP